MGLNLVGLAATLATFFGIWIGHVSVRKVESIAHTIAFPAAIYATLGVACEVGSILSAHPAMSAALGILGITFMFDAFEMVRQQRRIIHGHAPANPQNPRHARILREHAAATTLDLLKRQPVGRVVTDDEAISLLAGHE